MPAKGQITGMRGVYLVAAELARRGYIASPTSRSAAGADLLVTDALMKRAFSVQVKTNGKAARFWLVGKDSQELASDAYVYVFVNIKPKLDAPDVIDYYVVPRNSPSPPVVPEGHSGAAPAAPWRGPASLIAPMGMPRRVCDPQFQRAERLAGRSVGPRPRQPNPTRCLCGRTCHS